MAKFGIALASGARGLGFESRHSDQNKSSESKISVLGFFHFSARWVRGGQSDFSIDIFSYKNSNEFVGIFGVKNRKTRFRQHA